MLITSEKALQVTELTEWIKGSLERDFSDVAVEGEISNFRPASSGHCYFSLKDNHSLLNAVLFRSSVSKLTFPPTDGMKVIVRGRISVYNQRGTYQIICRSMKQKGQGDLLQLIEERKQKLALEGLFNEDRKQEIPSFPTRIAVVTSPTGAAIRDILQVLERRNPQVSIVLLPAAVQGAEAAEQIARQIDRANRFNLGDTLIIGRGGGSLEDLLPFSEEIVVRAVSSSTIPVISAVGHEIDVSLSDYAADLRAPTPSAAAELAVPDRLQLLRRIRELQKELPLTLKNKVLEDRRRLDNYGKAALNHLLQVKLEPYIQRVDDLKESLKENLLEQLYRNKQRLALSRQLLQERNPLTPLERGFARVSNMDKRGIHSSSELKPGDRIRIDFRKDSTLARVEEEIT